MRLTRPKNKLTILEYASVLDRLGKVETSVKDNRHILSDSSGHEVNAVVKRIILNMEDKIMVLEKKCDYIASRCGGDINTSFTDLIRPSTSREGTSAYASPAGLSAAHGGDGRAPSSTSQEGAVQALSVEIASVNQAIIQLKQDIQLSKVDIDHIIEQGQQHADLASRLNVLVDGAPAAAAGGAGGESTVLSLNRVQVMIAAAARQLVAGSKWITKDTFDFRLTEMRKEYMGFSRTLQSNFESQVAELGGIIIKMLPPKSQAEIKLPRMIAGQPALEEQPVRTMPIKDLPRVQTAPEPGDRAAHRSSSDRPTGRGAAAGMPFAHTAAMPVSNTGLMQPSPRKPVR